MISKTMPCESVENFLEQLVTKGPNSVVSIQELVYRGIAMGDGDNEHRLIPSALREDKFKELMSLTGSSSGEGSEIIDELKKEELTQARLEAKVLGSFFRFADAQGLPMSEITSQVRQLLQHSSTEADLFFRNMQPNHVWPPDELLPLASQAQHYGLPTRLLDWSRDVWVAIYFAAKGGMERIEKSCSDPCGVAVWILNSDHLYWEKKLARKRRNSHEVMDLPLTITTAPANSNPNLRAQQGVFTAWRPSFSRGIRQKTDRRPLEELLESQFESENVKITMPLLYKVTLPLDCVTELWRTLCRTGMNHARLFPDFSGAANAVREKARWR